jgi:hypothetical protein
MPETGQTRRFRDVRVESTIPPIATDQRTCRVMLAPPHRRQALANQGCFSCGSSAGRFSPLGPRGITQSSVCWLRAVIAFEHNDLSDALAHAQRLGFLVFGRAVTIERRVIARELDDDDS